jgi:rhamnosyltransferase
MTVFSIIVAYHAPPEPLLALAAILIADGSQVLVVDNTPESPLRQVTFPAQCRLISLGRNTGIAHAQNVGIEQALAHGASVVAFFDQDSEPAPRLLSTLAARLRLGQPDVVAPVCIDERTGLELPSFRFGSPIAGFVRKVFARDCVEPVPVDLVIASGSVATAATFKVAGLMDERLFIDFVDFEWCIRCRAKRIDIRVVPQAVMRHTIGQFAVDLGVMNGVVHSSARSYYKLRNGFLLFRNKHVPRSYAMRETAIALLQYLMLLPHVSPRQAYVKVLFRALGHGLRGVVGQDPA